MRPMPSDREIAAYADPQLQQHFLVSEEKLSKLVAAAEIRPTDKS
jgi:16S rRNA A1518/A1519 N6-dimethyltransferase RsmA/KsgA/DIM1 with predicted DNA glycosylase/AP lyase activity